MTDNIWENVCRCRAGSGVRCDRCLRLARKPAPDRHRERPAMTDAVRNELKLLGMTDTEIEELR
jgi:hypothetical protein